MSSAIEATGLQRSVQLPGGGELPILRDVNLAVGQGEFVSVVGRSGSGKSTLLAILGLLARPDHGSLNLAGEPALKISDAARARLRSTHLGFIFQNYSLLPHLTAAENVGLPLMQGPRMSRKRARESVRSSLDAVGLEDRGSAKPRHLSGGEQQRIAIARALVHEPGLILADEPTGALDETTSVQVLDILLRAVRERGTTLLLVTHDGGIAERADRVVTLVNGRLQSEADE